MSVTIVDVKLQTAHLAAAQHYLQGVIAAASDTRPRIESGILRAVELKWHPLLSNLLVETRGQAECIQNVECIRFPESGPERSGVAAIEFVHGLRRRWVCRR